MTTGIKASIEAAGGRDAVREAGDAREAAAGVQDELFAEANRELDAALPMQPPVKRGPGRPPGARNKRTQDLAAYYLGRYGDPLEGLLALGSGDLRHTLAQMATLARDTGLRLARGEDGLTVMDLMAFKRGCLEAALPYLHAKLAPTNDKGEAVVPILAFGTVAPGADAALRSGGTVSILDLVKVDDDVEQYQALGESGPEGSHGEGGGDGS